MVEIMNGCIYSTAKDEVKRNREIERYISLFYRANEILCPVYHKNVCYGTCMDRLSTTADYIGGIISVCRCARKDRTE